MIGELPGRANKLVGPHCGLIEYVYLLHSDRSGPGTVSAQPSDADIQAFVPGLEAGVQLRGAGKGFSVEESLMSAIGETVERYCLYWPPFEELSVAATEELPNETTISRERLAVYTPEQTERLTTLEPYDETVPIRWAEAHHLGTGEEWQIPAQITYDIDALLAHEEYPVYTLATSNGCAAGDCYEMALHNSIVEIIERDAFMRLWYSGEIPARIDPSNFSSVADRLAELENQNLTFEFFEMPTALDFTAVGCAAVSPEGTAPCFALGGSAALTPEAALEDALSEAAQGWTYVKDLVAQHGEVDIDPATLDNFEDNVLYYTYPEQFDSVSRLLTGPERQLDPTPPVKQPSGPAPKECVRRLQDAGMSPLAVDLTTPDVADCGFVVTRVHVPELVDLAMPIMPPVEHPRFPDDHITDPHPYP